MPQGTGGRRFWWGLLAAIVAAGLLSRVAHTGFRLFDKYLGDALYAAMVYVIFRLTGRIAACGGMVGSGDDRHRAFPVDPGPGRHAPQRLPGRTRLRPPAGDGFQRVRFVGLRRRNRVHRRRRSRAIANCWSAPYNVPSSLLHWC